jgi:hypothetical protein
LKAGEVDFLRTLVPTPRLFLIYNAIGNNFFEDPPPKKGAPRVVFNARQRGEADAAFAIAHASNPNLNVPDGTPIFANIESKQVGKISADWIEAWWKRLSNSKFKFGGLYGNFARRGPNIAFLGDAYNEAKSRMTEDFDPPIYPQFPIATEQHPFGQVPPQQIRFAFHPEKPEGFKGKAVIWQYGVNWLGKFAKDPETGKLKITVNGKFDTNLANQSAFDMMPKLGIGADPGDIAAAAVAATAAAVDIAFGASGTDIDPNEQVDEDVAAE